MKKIIQKFQYNSPVILTFTLIAVIVQIISTIPGTEWFHSIFTASRSHLINPFFYIGLFTHVIGHASWSHLIGNFTYILLVGPMLEEKYGSKKLLIMMATTAFVTSVINILFINVTLCGASGIVFMFILLASCANFDEGKIPVTLILAAIAYIGKEFIDIFKADDISQLSHILGGIFGAFFGFLFMKKKKTEF